MKSLIVAALLFLTALPATADNLPVNFLIWRGRAYNLDYLWGKGAISTVSAQPSVQTTTTPQPTESRETRDNNRRVEFENARSQIILERLRNMP